MAALRALPAKEAEAVTLTAWHGLGPAEAARVAGCTRTAFIVRLHRGRRRWPRRSRRPRKAPRERTAAPRARESSRRSSEAGRTGQPDRRPEARGGRRTRRGRLRAARRRGAGPCARRRLGREPARGPGAAAGPPAGPRRRRGRGGGRGGARRRHAVGRPRRRPRPRRRTRRDARHPHVPAGQREDGRRAVRHPRGLLVQADPHVAGHHALQARPGRADARTQVHGQAPELPGADREQR
ncbi:sigma factor-like helix-turn-helix DNA-binding protein [Actinomadura luteofluorescens]|uniref:sigma factor-like helix-turn-helix DNA-binding protein n=1 Tax=Actinomadura luteofluorescens TaxID=46163 RepID=UPI00362950C5